jgi:predicted RNA-binding protein with TRAM domain
MSYGQNMGGSSKPVETGKEYTVDITDTGKSGDGIAKIQGFIIFVKGAKVRDKNIKIKINSVGDRYATAEVVTGPTDTT